MLHLDRRRPGELRAGHMRRTAAVLRSLAKHADVRRSHEIILEAYHKRARCLLQEEDYRGRASPAQKLLRYRTRNWFRWASEEYELRTRTRSKFTDLFRHASTGSEAQWEDLLEEAFGGDWRELAVGPFWERSRLAFVAHVNRRFGLECSAKYADSRVQDLPALALGDASGGEEE